MKEPTISIQKTKADGIQVVGIRTNSAVTRKEILARCPACGRLIALSDDDVAEMWSHFDQWKKDGYTLAGIFDCPNEKCEMPFQIRIFSEGDTWIGSVAFYELEKPGVTLKAKRE